ncbi:MAG: hybrid sensor histidine kinase/response regulator, partial [Devosia sp.]|nr:hybrid sensor histidine kinase/response regulator [Devosia sp.]
MPETMDDLPFLQGGGETGMLLRATDWTKNSLGVPREWPAELKTVVGIAMTSRQPMLIVWGPEQTTLYNDGYAAMCGQRHPAALGGSFQALWFDIWAQVEPIISDAYNGVPTAMDDIEFTMHRHGYAEETHFAFSYNPVRNNDGAVLGMFCACTETTLQVLADRRIADEVTRQRLNLQAMPGFVAVLRGLEHIFEFVNEAYVRLGGARDYIGRNVREVFPELGGQSFYEMLDEVYATGNPVSFKAAPIKLQGEDEERFLDFLYTPIRDEAGLINGIFAGGYDVSERVRAEIALQRLNMELERKVVERTQARGISWQVTPDLMGALNPEGYFETSNPAWKAVLGWSEAEVASMSIFEMLHPDDVERTRGEIKLTLTGEPTIGFPNRYRHKDGSYRWISWVGVFEDGFVYCTGREFTEEKQAADDLVAAQEALRQSQKMEAVGQLTGGLAHDFNNILAGIGGSLEMMTTRLAQGRISDLDRYITGATGAARRAMGLTQRLLAFSRRQTLDPKPTDLNSLVNGMLDLVNRSVGPEIDVETAGAAGLWATFVDAGQLENALLNLCINARDAMPDGGKVTIETSNRWMDERVARDLGLEPGQYVSLCVTDTGTGMTPDVIARAFDPFYTTKPIGQGTGLGLSMVYGFAGQSGGSVRIYSEVGLGTTIAIYLPRHTGDAVVEDAETTLNQPPRADGGETIVLVDDEPLVRMIAGEQLEELGYVVLEASDGPTALRILNSDQE